MLNGNEANEQIRESMPDDWHQDGSSEWHETFEGGHLHRATYMRDPRISMMWGKTQNETFQTSWSNKAFGAATCESFHWVAMVHGNPIDNRVMLSADDGRYVLPMPEPGGMHIDSDQLTLARLVHDIVKTERFRTGLGMIDGFELPDWFTAP